MYPYSMPTKKRRINFTPSGQIYTALATLAKRDNRSISAKAAELIEMAIEFDEDDMLNELAEVRDTKDAKFLPHEKAWS